jgi:monoamine oxidase
VVPHRRRLLHRCGGRTIPKPGSAGHATHTNSGRARKLKSFVNQSCEVTAITQAPAGVKVIYTKDGKEKSAAGDFALVTVPAPVLQRMDIELSPAKRRAIRQMSYDSSTKVLALCKSRFWETNDKIFGGGTFTDLPSGSTYYPSDNATAKDPAVSAGLGILLASYTWGTAARRLAAMPHAKRSEVVLRHLSKVHPELLDPKFLIRTASWAWDTYPWSAGAFAWFEPGQQINIYRDLIAPEGRIHFAGEHTSLAHTWMQGALESGLRAVDAMLRPN